MIGKQQCVWVCSLGVLLTLAGVGPALAQHTAKARLLPFSNSTLFGSYILRFAGYNTDKGFADGLGIFSFDGKGNLSGADLQGLDCHVSGSYSMNGDGTGSVSIAPACLYHLPGDWNFVIADRLGGKIYAFASAVSATFTRRVILRHRFTAADLSGSYAFLIRTSFPGAMGAGELAGVGILHPDGKGTASATIALQAQFATCSGTTNGTYTVNPDGTGTLSLAVIWVPPNCVYSEPVSLTLTPWSFVFDHATGNRLDLYANSELVDGTLSRQ